jgi:hypothetical protein
VGAESSVSGRSRLIFQPFSQIPYEFLVDLNARKRDWEVSMDKKELESQSGSEIIDIGDDELLFQELEDRVALKVELGCGCSCSCDCTSCSCVVTF